MSESRPSRGKNDLRPLAAAVCGVALATVSLIALKKSESSPNQAPQYVSRIYPGQVEDATKLLAKQIEQIHSEVPKRGGLRGRGCEWYLPAWASGDGLVVENTLVEEKNQHGGYMLATVYKEGRKRKPIKSDPLSVEIARVSINKSCNLNYSYNQISFNHDGGYLYNTPNSNYGWEVDGDANSFTTRGRRLRFFINPEPVQYQLLPQVFEAYLSEAETVLDEASHRENINPNTMRRLPNVDDGPVTINALNDLTKKI